MANSHISWEWDAGLQQYKWFSWSEQKWYYRAPQAATAAAPSAAPAAAPVPPPSPWEWDHTTQHWRRYLYDESRWVYQQHQPNVPQSPVTSAPEYKLSGTASGGGTARWPDQGTQTNPVPLPGGSYASAESSSAAQGRGSGKAPLESFEEIKQSEEDGKLIESLDHSYKTGWKEFKVGLVFKIL